MKLALQFIAISILSVLFIFGGTFWVTVELAKNDCAVRNAHSPWNYHYSFPWNCVYTGNK